MPRNTRSISSPRIDGVFFALLLVFLCGLSPCVAGDRVHSLSGDTIEGALWEYDELSYLLVLPDGNRVVIPRAQVKEIEAGERPKPRYGGEEKRVVTEEWTHRGEPSEKILIVRLVDCDPAGQRHSLRDEARILDNRVTTDRRYAEAYLTSYLFGSVRYELEYHREKDLLVRRIVRPGLGTRTLILGPRGKGRETMDEATRGRVEEAQEGILTRLQQPSSVPHRKTSTIEPRKKAPPPRQRKNWYDF